MIRFLLNPTAGRGRSLGRRDALHRLADSLEAKLDVSESPAHFIALAREAVEDGVRRLVVVGGDGSLHHALQALAGTECELGIIPAGRGNDIARSLGLPSDPKQAEQVAVRSPARAIDLGRIGPRFFASVAGAGFHSAVAEYATAVRLVRGPAVYPYAVLRTLRSFEPPVFRIEFDGGVFEDRAWMIALANAPYFGGGMRIAPDARVDDGQLDLVILRHVPRLRLLRVLPRVYSGRHVEHPAVLTARTTGALITIDRPDAYYGDGERLVPSGSDPVRLSLAPEALRVAAPELSP